MPASDHEYPVAPPAPLKGRGAVTSMQGLYEKDEREHVDDGWLHVSEDGESGDEVAPPLRTQVFEERAKSILTHNNSPDIPFGVSLNPYRGCEHGCALHAPCTAISDCRQAWISKAAFTRRSTPANC